MKIGCIASTVEASKQGLKSVKMKMEIWAKFVQRHSGEIIVPPRLMNQVEDSLQEYNSSTPWIEHEINTLLQKPDWWQKKKNMKKEDKTWLISTTMPAKQKELQM